MVTTAQDYFSNLARALHDGPPNYALLPSPDNIYNVDVETRVITAPKFVGVTRDHRAESIYFIIDRYVGHMDLATCSCLVHYINANGDTRIYHVPFFDIYKYSKEKKMVFPWVIDAQVAAVAGPIQFSIQFYKIGEIINEKGQAEKIITYSLNTLPAGSEVKQSIELDREEVDSDYLLSSDEADDIYSEIDGLKQIVSQNYVLRWTTLA